MNFLRFLCYFGLHKMGEVRQYGGGRPNSKCLHCGCELWMDAHGEWRDDDE